LIKGNQREYGGIVRHWHTSLHAIGGKFDSNIYEIAERNHSTIHFRKQHIKIEEINFWAALSTLIKWGYENLQQNLAANTTPTNSFSNFIIFI